MSEKVTSNKRKTRLPNHEISFVIYLTRVLKQVQPDAGITKVAILQINSILNYVARTVNSVCTRLLELDDRKTVTSRDVQSAIRMIFPGELLKHAVSESLKAVTKHNSSHSEANKKIASNVRAGLQFSISKTRKFFTQQRIGSGASVYLAGTLEYLAAEIMELSGNLARDSKKVRITTRHVFLAIENDEELKKLLDRVGIVIASGGVVPTLEKIERHYRKDKKTNKMIAISGTRAQQDIKAQQGKYGSVDFAKAPFERLVRILVNDQRKDSGLSPDAALALQVAVEGKTLEVFQSALAVSKSSKRQKVTSSDFNTALAIMKVEIIEVHSSLIKDQQFVVKAAIKRLAHKAGIKLLSGKIYDDVRAFIHGFTYLIVAKAVISMMSCRRKRLSLTDVLFGLETFGIKLAYASKKKKAPKPT